jgi:putative nucleotidyltransferase with HDIG domain
MSIATNAAILQTPPLPPVLPRPHFVLIVDDEPEILNVAIQFLQAVGHQCLTARNASKALEMLRNPDYHFDLMLTDVMMSGMSGIDLTKQALEILPDLPVITMSGTSELQTPVAALRAGSIDYLIKPFTGDELITAFARALARRNDPNETITTAKWQTAAQAFALSLDARDKETEGHAERVVAYSVRLGQELGLSATELIALELGARLHDIGKIAVPDHILKKPAKLTEDEWVQMKLHPAKGQEMVRNMGLPRTSADIVGQHHEKWDGTGYPLGLKGEDITLGARVFSVADTFDAITSDRCYRRGRPYEVSLAEILAFSGTQFDPQVVEAFTRIDPQEWLALKLQCPSEIVNEKYAVAS